MDKIIIRDLNAAAHIGISESERSALQPILINAELYTDTRAAAQSDAIEDCVNYSAVAKMLLQAAADNKRKTVEAFAEDLARICLKLDKVSFVRIRVEKTSAVRFTEACGVEIERGK